jgi:hypothetical protein
VRSRAGLIAIIAICIVAVAIVNIRRGHVCLLSKGEYVTEDFGITVGPAAIRPVRAVADRCADAIGTRYPSLVTVIDDDDDSRVIATLIGPEQNLHVYTMTVSGLTVTVTFTDWGGGDRGAMYRQSFASTDGTTYSRGPRIFLSAPCTTGQLGLSAVPAAEPDLTVLRVRNTSRLGCVLEGYPTAVGAPAGVPVARTEFFDGGSNGGGSNGAGSNGAGSNGAGSILTAPPIVLLQPGQVASAAVSSADEAPDGGAVLCTSLTKLAVGLASAATLGTVAAPIRVCDFQVHSWLPGQRS